MDVAGFVGVAAKGPLDQAVAIEGWPQFVAIFGEFLPNAFLAYAVRGFFDNGGRRCVVVRVAAPEVLAETSGAQPADGSASVVLDAGGIRAGAAVTLRQDSATTAAGAQPADRLSTLVADAHGFFQGARAVIRQAGAAPVFATVRTVDTAAAAIGWQAPLAAALDLTLPFSIETHHAAVALVDSVAGTTIGWTQPLDPRFDTARPISLAAGAGAAQATIADEAGLPVLLVTASSPGQWGNGLAVRIATTLATETRTRIRAMADTPDMLTLERVVNLAAGSTVALTQAGASPARRLIARVDVADRRVALDAPLAGFDLAGAADGTKPITLRRLSFALSVTDKGRLAESFTDLDLPGAEAPGASPVNQASRLIRITRLTPPGYPFPDPSSGLLSFGQALLEGGRDGIAMLRPIDVTGAADAAEKSGLRQFETVDEPAALAIPDTVIPPLRAVFRDTPAPPPEDPCDICAPPRIAAAFPPPPVLIEAAPAFGPDDVCAIQSALIEHCQLRGDRLAALDPPLHRDGPDPWDLDALAAWRQQFDSSYAAAYFPWATVVDPIAVPPEAGRDLPFSGHALGQFAQADGEDGHPAPANRPISFISALPRQLDDVEHAGLNLQGVNCLRVAPGRGIRIMGARTLASHPDWRQLTVRRTVIRLKRVLSRALRWAVFEPNDRSLAATVIAQVEGYLESEWIAQRLTGARPEDAYYVRPAMTADDFDNGRFVLEIGIAPSQPAEFVILRLTRSEDRLDLAELASPTGWPS